MANDTGREKIAEPSYALSLVGGLFLGILGMTIVMYFPANKWVMAVVPLTGLLAGWLGAYVAAEPYVELKEQYDALIGAAATAGFPGGGDCQEKQAAITGLIERMDAEGTRLVREAAEAGEDGVRLAAVAEYLRGEVGMLRNLSELK